MCSSLNALGFSLDEKAFQRAGMDYILDCKIIEYASLDEFYKKNNSPKIFFITRYGNNIYYYNSRQILTFYIYIILRDIV